MSHTLGWNLVYADTLGNMVWFGALAGAEQCFGQAFQICLWLQTPKPAVGLKALLGARPLAGVTVVICVLVAVQFRRHSVWVLALPDS